MSEEARISIGSYHTTMTEDLDMRRGEVTFVPLLLTVEQESLFFAATDFLQCADSEAKCLENIITGDETWIYGYDPETKVQSSVWKSPSSPRPKNLAKFEARRKT